MAATKKRETRKSMKQPAWITLDGGFAARHCMVQNISSAGAKITLDEAAGLPSTIRLAFSATPVPAGSAGWCGGAEPLWA